MADATKKGGGFATLADSWRGCLIKPDRIALPVEQLFGLARKDLDKHCHGLLSSLDRAHRIVLQDDFTKLAALFSAQPPSVLIEAYKNMRMPFETLWIEWDDHVRNTWRSAGRHTPKVYWRNRSRRNGSAC